MGEVFIQPCMHLWPRPAGHRVIANRRKASTRNSYRRASSCLFESGKSQEVNGAGSAEERAGASPDQSQPKWRPERPSIEDTCFVWAAYARFDTRSLPRHCQHHSSYSLIHLTFIRCGGPPCSHERFHHFPIPSPDWRDVGLFSRLTRAARLRYP